MEWCLMKRAAMAGLILSMVMATAPARAADEEWLVFGGDGGAYGFDRKSMIKAATGEVTVQHGVFTADPQTLNGTPYTGLIGSLVIDCKARTAAPGSVSLYGAAGVLLSLAPPADRKASPIGVGNPRAIIADIICEARKGVDPHLAAGRPAAIDLMRAMSRQAHVKTDAAKGWAFAAYTTTALLAIDTSSTKRAGDIAQQTEMTWMRNDQTTNGQAWRYNQVAVEYDCAGKKRRGAGSLQFFAADGKLVHEEALKDQAWTPLPAGSPMLDMACNGRKLAGLPVGAREAMIARLRELAVLM